MHGFLQKVSDFYMSDSQSSYSFLHLTVQEYFAALYWSQNLSVFAVEQTMRSWVDNPWMIQYNGFKNGTNHVALPEGHWIVLLFFAGLTKLANIPIKELMPLVTDDRWSTNIIINFPLCYLLFECQCPRINLEILTNRSYHFDTGPNHLDNFVHGYCITHSHPSSLWNLLINNDKQVEMMSNGDELFRQLICVKRRDH